MEHRHRVAPTFGHAPDYADLAWFNATLADAMYVVAPDTAAQPVDQGERPAERVLVSTIALAIGLLVAVLGLMAAVA